MNKIQKSQKGFAHFETLLLLAIVLLIIGIGWFVWHTKQQADKNYDAASAVNMNTPVSKKTSSATSPSQKSTKSTTVTYTSSDNQNGVPISSDADIDKLEGASDSFKQFIKDKVDKNSHSPSPCGNAYGLFVMKIYKDEFALGNEKQCNSAQKLWAKVSDQWNEIGSAQDNFDCTILEQYKVPSAIVENCTKNGQLIKNTQN
jgi:uncharacterized protein (UPF0333 family)